ncbi:tetratricopeptide repeat protein [Magnetospirillum sp. 15-1]|uniref:tetratricopeptide repeat protein n=1 Tax=Magnetospirillum sp. 15-1 TaxID=1979370 RepID=UPI000BBBA21F|nr:tetratricopeptide repeat protein [Magnetospirillum sp. 15-1]
MAKLDRVEEALGKARMGDLSKARTVSRDLGKVPPGHSGLMAVAVAAHQAGDLPLALKFLDRAAVSGSVDALYGRGVVLGAMGRLDEARAAFAKCLERAPAHEAALTNLGGLQQMAGDLAAAERSYRAVLDFAPQAALALHNLAGLCLAQGRRDEAEDLARRAFDLQPGPDTALRLADILGEAGRYAEAVSMLRPVLASYPGDARLWRTAGHASKKLGNTAEAVAAYRAALDLDPQDGEARHMIAALTGTNTERAPADYVRGFFDTYADRFESHLVEDVKYQAPATLRALFDRVGDGLPLDAVIDLGCGTGLTAQAFQGIAGRFFGVDLSPRMLQLAAATGLYTELREADAATALARSVDLSAVLATDLFIYVGDLEDIFAGASRALAPGGWLLFSVETGEGEGYTLRPSGRYAQSPAYIRALIARHGLTEVACERGRIRGGSDGDIDGDYWVVRKP